MNGPDPWDFDEPILDLHVDLDGRRVLLVGELDVSTCDRLTSTLATLVGRGQGDVVVDLAGLTFLDGAAMAMLASAADDLGRWGARLLLLNPSDRLRRVLGLGGLTGLVAGELAGLRRGPGQPLDGP